MRCEVTQDPDEFWAAASTFLLADPVRNNILVTVVGAKRAEVEPDGPPSTYATVYEGGSVVGAAMRTPPRGIYISAMPAAAIDTLAGACAAACPDASGVTGTVEDAGAFVAAWACLTGEAAEAGMLERIFRLDAVIAPAPVHGAPRLAVRADRDLLVAWTVAFAVEADPGSAAGASAGPDPAELAGLVDARLAQDRAWVWADAAGTPLSYVGTQVPVAGVVRIGPVYTPPELRRRGYASALVAAVSQGCLDAGARACSLYTDLGNPTSNKIYAAIGYQPVCDVTAYRFRR